MKNKLLTTTLFLSLATAGSYAHAADSTPNPEADRQALTKYIMDMHGSTKFNGHPLKVEDLRYGAYVFSEDKFEQLKAAEEFPPYLDHIDAGEKLWKKPFANGKTYATCAGFDGDVKSIRPKYPLFDDARGEVVNLDQAINDCRVANGEKPYAYGSKDKDLDKIMAYLGYQARGKKINVVINSPGALDAYKQGEMLFHTRRGQLNQACSGCHIGSAGRHIRSNILSTIIGHTTHFPTYRANDGDLVSLQKRYVGCMKSVRAFPFPANSKELKAIEFYEAFMSSGLEIDAPGYRE